MSIAIIDAKYFQDAFLRSECQVRGAPFLEKGIPVSCFTMSHVVSILRQLITDLLLDFGVCWNIR